MSALPEGQRQRRRPPRSRFLFDENLPWRVASALRQLEYNVSYVGNEEDGAPTRGSSDEEILEYARETNQVVVTSNHDMILLCLEQPQPVVWLDPHGRKITRDEMVVLVFLAAHEWEDMLQSATGPVCIRTLRTKNECLSVERAVRLVQQRMKRIAAKRRGGPKPKPLGQLLEPTSE